MYKWDLTSIESVSHLDKSPNVSLLIVEIGGLKVSLKLSISSASVSSLGRNMISESLQK